MYTASDYRTMTMFLTYELKVNAQPRTEVKGEAGEPTPVHR